MTVAELSALGASNLRRIRRFGSADEFTFDIPAAAAETFPSGAAVEIDGLFAGTAVQNETYLSGPAQRLTVRLSGPWLAFERTIFRQTWTEYDGSTPGSVAKPRAVLFGTSYTEPILSSAQINAIVAHVISAGGGFSFTPITGGINPPMDEQVNITCAQALIKCLAYHPSYSVWFDYSTVGAVGGGPVLHIGEQSGTITPDYVENLTAKKREDLQVPGIALYYEKMTTVDGEARPTTYLDSAGAAPGTMGVISAVYDLKGDTVTSVSSLITAEAFPLNLNAKDWWKARVSWLAGYNDDDIVLTGGARAGASSLSNILVSGQALDEHTPTIEAEKVSVKAKLTKRDNGGAIIAVEERKITLDLKVTGSQVGDKLYRFFTVEDVGEPVPTGVAESMFASFAEEWSEGSFTSVDATAPLFSVGSRVDVYGFKGMVQTIEEHFDSGTTTVQFGPPKWLDVDARVMFQRAAVARRPPLSLRYATGRAVSGGTPIPPVEVVETEGSDQLIQRRITLPSDSAYAHEIQLDPALVDGVNPINPSDAGEPVTSAALTIRPRKILTAEMRYIDGYWVAVLTDRIVMCSEPIGGGYRQIIA